MSILTSFNIIFRSRTNNINVADNKNRIIIARTYPTQAPCYARFNIRTIIMHYVSIVLLVFVTGIPYTYNYVQLLLGDILTSMS